MTEHQLWVKEKGPFDIIGDVHGCLAELQFLLTKLGWQPWGRIYRHPEARKLVFLGDVGDRGPHCLDSYRLAMGLVRDQQALYVPGNHCNKLYRYFLGRRVQIAYGMEKTIQELHSLSQADYEYFRAEYMDFYTKLRPYLILDGGNLVVTHGGIKEHMIGHLNKRVQDFCLYGDATGEVTAEGLPVRRDWAKHYHGRALVVYGHTSVNQLEFRNNTIDIDTGCATGGYLTGLRYPEKELVQVKASAVYYVRPTSHRRREPVKVKY